MLVGFLEEESRSATPKPSDENEHEMSEKKIACRENIQLKATLRFSG